MSNNICLCRQPNWNAFTDRCMTCGGYYQKKITPIEAASSINIPPPMSNNQLPALSEDIKERLNLEAKNFAFYNWVIQSNKSADFENIESWPEFAQVAYYAIVHYMTGIKGCWPYSSKTLPMEWHYELKAQSGPMWVKASDFDIKYNTTYYAMREGENYIIKGTGWFQKSDGAFFWNEQGYVPVLKKDHDDLIILDESGATDLLASNEELKKLVKHYQEVAKIENELYRSKCIEHEALKEKADKMEAALNSIIDKVHQRHISDGNNPLANELCNEAREALAWKGEEQPKLTPEQIAERKEAINWYRNPSGEVNWHSVIDRPLIKKEGNGTWTTTEDGSEEFIAAVPYHDSREPGKTLWWIRHCVIEDQTGLCVVGDDDNYPAGWEIESIEYWLPWPLAPEKEVNNE